MSEWLDAIVLRNETPRWRPENASSNALLSTIFTWWNLLDAQMAVHSPKYRWATGYMREIQLRRMMELIQGKKRYCEIGMNGGHSAVAMLLSNEHLEVHSFDLIRPEGQPTQLLNYSWPIANLLRQTFGHRFVLHPGNSRGLVPAAARDGLSCDVIFIDGEHTTQGACIDTFHSRGIAADEHTLVVMGYVSKERGSGPRMVFERWVSEGRLTPLEQFGPYEHPSPHSPCMRTPYGPLCQHGWGFVIATYNSSGFRD